METMELDDTVDVEAILVRQENAMALLARLRSMDLRIVKPEEPIGGGRRDFKRWPTPPGVTIELHDGKSWHLTKCKDLGIGGARVIALPTFAEGPTPARLTGVTATSVLVLSDVMWIDHATQLAGLRFEFLDNDERDLWSISLIDSLLARYAVL